MCIAVAPPPSKPKEKGDLIRKTSAVLLWPLRTLKQVMAWAGVEDAGGNTCGTAYGRSCRNLR